MNAKNDSALMPRSPTAVEKAEPSAKRILTVIRAILIDFVERVASAVRENEELKEAVATLLARQPAAKRQPNSNQSSAT